MCDSLLSEMMWFVVELPYVIIVFDGGMSTIMASASMLASMVHVNVIIDVFVIVVVYIFVVVDICFFGV